MAVINCVGVPFPFSHPDFLGDKKLQIKIKQLENYIELHHDLAHVSEHIEQIIKIKNLNDNIFDIGLNTYSIIEGLGCAAVMQYAKCFTDSQGRTSLKEKDVQDIFTQQNYRDFHDFFMNLRNRFFAHHQLEANRHQIFVFQATEVRPIKLNPFGQSGRSLVSYNIDWKPLQECISIVDEYLKLKISDNCTYIEKNLSPQQQNIINNTSGSDLLHEYWRENSNKRKSPLSFRSKD